jgi:hypothetical protein
MSTLPKHKSRPITVKKQSFRYLVKDKSQGALKVLTVTVQKSTPPSGSTFSCTLVSKYLTEEDQTNPASLTPKDIRLLILTALDKGWDPSEGQGVFTIAEQIMLESWSTRYDYPQTSPR